VGGAHAARLVPERAVLHDQRHGGVPGRGAAQPAPACRAQRPAVLGHVEATAGRGRRSEGKVCGALQRAVGAAPRAHRGCDRD
jgi:hypothetical protein